MKKNKTIIVRHDSKYRNYFIVYRATLKNNGRHIKHWEILNLGALHHSWHDIDFIGDIKTLKEIKDCKNDFQILTKEQYELEKVFFNWQV